jgi:hypothetical protein
MPGELITTIPKGGRPARQTNKGEHSGQLLICPAHRLDGKRFNYAGLYHRDPNAPTLGERSSSAMDLRTSHLVAEADNFLYQKRTDEPAG